MKNLLLALSLALPAGSALAQAADVGLINMTSPNVTYVSPGGTSAKVQPYMRVRDGDRVDVPAGATVRIIFFDGARVETWSGPASFRAGRVSSERISGAAAEISSLPENAPQRIARVPQLIQIAKLGGIQVRSINAARQTADQKAAIDEARKSYEAMRSELPADDITPELYFLSALNELGQGDQMKSVADEMMRKQPNNEDAKAISAWVYRWAGK